MIREFDVAMSLGPTCRAQYQLQRLFGKAACPSGIFGSQGTPWQSVLAYLRGNFRGAFERQDLIIQEDPQLGRGIVVNRRFYSRHTHEFPKGVTVEQFGDTYPLARARHDYLANRARSILGGRGRVLLCLSRPLKPLAILRLWARLRLSYPGLRFILLNGPRGDSAGDGITWTGEDAVWDRHLSAFRHRLTPDGLAPDDEQIVGLPSPP